MSFHMLENCLNPIFKQNSLRGPSLWQTFGLWCTLRTVVEREAGMHLSQANQVSQSQLAPLVTYSQFFRGRFFCPLDLLIPPQLCSAPKLGLLSSGLLLLWTKLIEQMGDNNIEAESRAVRRQLSNSEEPDDDFNWAWRPCPTCCQVQRPLWRSLQAP